jgi:Trk-type K+ transport system membrane component
MKYTNNKTKSDISCDNQLNQRRFMINLSILRMGGISFHNKSSAKYNTLYSVACVVCVFITLFCVMMDIITHRHDLVYAMQKLRFMLAMFLALWIHFSLRYVIL